MRSALEPLSPQPRAAPPRAPCSRPGWRRRQRAWRCDAYSKRAMRRSHTKDFAACVAVANKDHSRAIPRAAQAERFRRRPRRRDRPPRRRLRHAPPQRGRGGSEAGDGRRRVVAAAQPWVHYVPVSSDLGNLSDAVRWARVHDVRAQRMPAAAAATIERALSTRALLAYVRELVARYARLYARGGGVDGGGRCRCGRTARPARTLLGSTCEVRGVQSECFVRPRARSSAAPGGSVREIAAVQGRRR